MRRTALTALIASIATAIALIGGSTLLNTEPSSTCTPEPCPYPLSGLSFLASDEIEVAFEAPVVLFWVQETGPINRFEPPTWTDTEAPYGFTPDLPCGYVVDVMVILPVETPQDTGGARRLLHAEVACGTP